MPDKVRNVIDRIGRGVREPSRVGTCLRFRWRRLIEHVHARRDARRIGEADKVLFLDLGANLGQAYTWFSGYFEGPNIRYELFEPNPFCCDRLAELEPVRSGRVGLNRVGVGARAGVFKFYGLADAEGGRYSQGGSILQDHASDWYRATEDAAIEVVRLADVLRNLAPNHDKVICKMDIEGAEVEVLEDLIADDSIGLLDVLYVEFHSAYQAPGTAERTKRREDGIVRRIRRRGDVRLRVWH